MRMWLILAAMCCAGPLRADAALAERIVAGLNQIWPEERYEIQFDGCEMIYLHLRPEGDIQQYFWLADWQTAPDQVRSTAQAMSDGAVVWTDVNIWYAIRPDLADDPGAARLRAALEAIPDTHRTWFFQRRDPTAPEVALRAEIEAGAFGDLVRRNRGWAEWTDERGALQGHVNGYPDSVPAFTFRQVVADRITAELHAYAQAHCEDAP